jgi:glycosyltransferase involved in cell wall biosynthesis
MPVDVSCIIITHDRDPLLREALASVLAQDLRTGVEVLVVDDTDSASTREVVEELAGSSYGSVVRYVVAQTDPKGASASRNVGADAARGRLLAFLDDDDLWTTAYLSDCVDRLRESGAEFVVTWMTVLERDGQTAPLLRMPEGLTAAECVAHNRGMTGSNIVLTRSAFDAVGGFDEHLRVSNDKDLLVRLLAAGLEYRIVPRFNAVHRRHAGPQLTRMDEKRAVGLLAYLEKHSDIASSSDRRFILKTVHGIRRRSAPTFSSRLVHLGLFLFNQSPRDVIVRALRRPARDGSYKSA